LLFSLAPLLSTPDAPRLPIVEPAMPLLVQDTDEDELPDKRPEIKELCKKLADHVKRRGKEDKEAIEVIDTLYEEFKKSGPKDRAAIAKELGKCFKAKRKEIEKGIPDNGLFIACAVALGDMAPESVKILDGLVGHKDHRNDLVLQRKLILSLGKTKDLKTVKTLQELLKHHHPEIQAAGAEALGEYAEADQKLRKQLFEDLLKALMSQNAKTVNDPLDTLERDRYQTIAGPIFTTLKLISPGNENGPDAWQRWWNKNKRKDWDEGKDEG